MKQELFLSKILLHPNPSNFNIGTVISYVYYYVSYNDLGQRIGFGFNNRYFSNCLFDKQSIYFDKGDFTEIMNYQFELIQKVAGEKMSESMYGPNSNLKYGVKFYDHTIHYLFQNIVFDYFKALYENDEQINSTGLAKLFNNEIFIDFIAIQNILEINFTGTSFIDTFFKHIIDEINHLSKTGKTTIHYENMSEYILCYFKNSNFMKKVSSCF